MYSVGAKTKGSVMSEPKPENGGPAFPQNLPDDFVWRLSGDPGGMSLRDWFAGQALAGLYADSSVNISAEKAAEAVYKTADAMLRAREKVFG